MNITLLLFILEVLYYNETTKSNPQLRYFLKPLSSEHNFAPAALIMFIIGYTQLKRRKQRALYVYTRSNRLANKRDADSVAPPVSGQWAISDRPFGRDRTTITNLDCCFLFKARISSGNLFVGRKRWPFKGLPVAIGDGSSVYYRRMCRGLRTISCR